VPTLAALSDLRGLIQLLAPQPKPEASDETIAAVNQNAKEIWEAREKSRLEQEDRVRRERAVFADAQRKLVELNQGGAPDPLVEEVTRRKIHEAHNPPAAK
jgi:hypothetical protein